MRSTIKAIAIALSFGACINFADPARAQDGRETAARELVAEALTTSRVPEIYGDLRRTIHEVWLPVMNEALAGKIPGGMSSDPTDIAIMTKLVAIVSYASKAADEVEPVLTANRETMIADASQLLSKHFTAEEIGNMRGALRLTATRKGIDAVYATSRVITDYTYEETRAAQEFGSWTQDLAKRIASKNVQPQTPAPERVAKAQAIVTELMRVGHIDEMAADGLRFAKDVVLKTAPMESQEAMRVQIDQFEFQYNLQKQVMMAAAPAALASYLNDTDLDKLQALIRTSAMVKMFNLVFDMEKSVTRFTVQDIAAARAYIDEMEKGGKIRMRTDEEKQALDADFQALSAKWSETLMNAVSPQTRDGLMQAIVELQTLPIPGVTAQPL